jgi:photosystem II stability/assembly factor-like uncharacterized protein
MKSKKRTRVRASKKTAPKRAGKVALPPDNPLLRHKELSSDRCIKGEEALPSASLLRALAATSGRKSAKFGKRKAKESTEAKLADLRLAAWQHSRRMAGHDTGGPVMAMRRALSAAAPGGIAMVAPVAGTSNWVQLGPTVIPNGQTSSAARVLVTGRITAIVVDPTNTNIIYIGTAQGGVWKTTDGGLDWSPKSDNEVSLAIGALAMDPSNHLILYAGTGEGNFSGDSYYGNGVLKTIDGGNTWTTLAQSTFTGTRFGRIAITPGTPTRLFAATSDGLYRSTNGGATWTKMSGSSLPDFDRLAPLDARRRVTDVCIDPLTPTTVYTAFWGGGIYKSTNAGAATPTWTKLAGGLPSATAVPPNGFTRIALGISPSSPQTIYALFANNDITSPPTGPHYRYAIDKFYVTTDGGSSWNSIPLPKGPGIGIGGQGFYNLNVAVAPSTPDIVYLSGMSVWKAVRNTSTNTWMIKNVGKNIHSDNHALAFQPGSPSIIYAGCDGGIYKSIDAGTTWSDTINKGPCITQFEFIDQHPTSDAVIFGGTQDNGTVQFRNSPVFNQAADGDGGFVIIDQTQPKNVLHTYYGNTPERSTLGGKCGKYAGNTHQNWTDVSNGIVPDNVGLFYPPMTLDQTNQGNIAFGTNRINLDASQGTSAWPTKIILPNIGKACVSAIHYVNSNLIYVGTDAGQVYCLANSGGSWTATAIHASPLPDHYIWDIVALPTNVNEVIVVMSGFRISHVWHGAVAKTGTSATWTNISGTGTGTLPDIPANALVIDPAAPDTYYIATDVAVYRTINAGASWTQFSEGLPNCAVFDLRLHNPTRLLRAATHGRGLWERKLDVASMPDVDLFFRDHLMATGRETPTPSPVMAAFEDPSQYVSLGDQLWWWQCADIKVDALQGAVPSYQKPVATVDYLAFENKLQHRNAQRGKTNRVYVQVHNRGFAAGANVTVKVLYADASTGLPPLPADFWTAFPNDSSNITCWKPIGTAKVIPSLSPTEPTVLEWDWNTPMTAADHTCLLVVMDSPANPIPPGNKVFDIGILVSNEKRVGLKNLHVVNAPPGTSTGLTLGFYGVSEKAQTIRILPSRLGGWSLGLMFPKQSGRSAIAQTHEGWTMRKPADAILEKLKQRFGPDLEKYDSSVVYTLTKGEKGGQLVGIKTPKAGLNALLVLGSPARAKGVPTFTIVQEEDGRVVGGSTFVLRARKQV